jgi:hypothetical protein
MNVKRVPCYESKLYIGSKEGYREREFSQEELMRIIEKFQSQLPKKQLCNVRIVSCTYLNGGKEKGWEISTVNSPNSPKDKSEIDEFMIKLGEHLMKIFKQYKINIVNTSEVILLESENPIDKQKLF